MPAAYLDHAATTPLRAEALAAMEPWLRGQVGNPSGSHQLARRARRALDDAREVVAECLGCAPGDVVFTSGGTEGANLAVQGAFRARPGRLVCSAVEHHAVLEPVRSLGGVTVPVDQSGIVDLDALDAVLDRDVVLVSVMLANNEVGTVEPLPAVAELVRRRAPEALVHTDAVHGVCWLDVARLAEGADLVTVSAHKFGGPQGVGAMVSRGSIPVRPLLLGGGQERDRRPGTQNVAGIAGLAAALAATTADRTQTVRRVARLRSRLADGLHASVDGLQVTGAPEQVAGTCHVRVPGIDREELLFLLDQAGVYASAGASCASGALQPSHVLSAMGWTAEQASGAVRFSLGTTTTEAEVEWALAVVPQVVGQLRSRGGAA